jgi:hypothetical protein
MTKPLYRPRLDFSVVSEGFVIAAFCGADAAARFIAGSEDMSVVATARPETVLWSQDVDGDVGDSFDAAADTMYERMEKMHEETSKKA